MIPIIDFHCHPSLKIYLCSNKIYRRHPPAIPGIPIGMDVDLYGMRDGGVQVAFCSHYIPEADFGKLPKSKKLFRFLQRIRLGLIRKFEKDNNPDDAWKKMLQSMDKLNNQIEIAKKRKFNVAVANCLQEFDVEFEKGKTIILHSAEGSHQLGRGLSSEQYIERLAKLKSDHGLALLTIGHFFPNDICDSGGGIPPKIAKAIGYKVPEPKHNGLSPEGKDVVNWCQDKGVIIDLVHCTEKGRKDVFDLLCERKEKGLKVRPVIFSHTGLREVAECRMKNPDDIRYLPNIAELKMIQTFGGVLGLILFDYWITGEEPLLKSIWEGRTQKDIEALATQRINDLMTTIRLIHDKLGTYENIAIGTDMDGFTHVPDDITHIRFIGRLRDRMVEELGEKAAYQICCGNALRVIKEGWS